MDLLILELTRPRTLVSNQLTIGEGTPVILQLLAVYCIIHVYCLISFAHAGCLCNIISLHHHFYMQSLENSDKTAQTKITINIGHFCLC